MNRIKGKQFSVPELLGNDEKFEGLQGDEGAMLMIARLAPQVRLHFRLRTPHLGRRGDG